MDGTVQISFQGHSGEVPDSAGLLVREVLAVTDREYEPLAYYVLVHVGGVWVRLMLDEGVLFVEKTHAPGAVGHEDEIDVLSEIALPSGPIQRFAVQDGVVLLSVADWTLVVVEDPESCLAVLSLKRPAVRI